MDRFEYCTLELSQDETIVIKHSNVRLYDGDIKTNFQRGELILSSHRLFWQLNNITLCLSLSYIVNIIEEEKSMFNVLTSGRKLILYLNKSIPGKNLGPVSHSNYDYIKLSFRDGIHNELIDALNNTIDAKIWTVQNKTTQQTKLREIKTRTGIVGIERNLEEKQQETSSNINNAFKDLNQLIGLAKNMVEMSKNISNKIINRQGEITEDETLQFKSYLLSLGIDDPVTRTSCKTETQYYNELSKELINIIKEPLSEKTDGTMLLTDVYCHMNRARGLELISPEDLLNACLYINENIIDSPLYLKINKLTNVKVLQLKLYEDINYIESIYNIVKENLSITIEQYSTLRNKSLIQSKQNLLLAEQYGKLCRDETIEGIKFYPNLFIEQS